MNEGNKYPPGIREANRLANKRLKEVINQMENSKNKKDEAHPKPMTEEWERANAEDRMVKRLEIDKLRSIIRARDEEIERLRKELLDLDPPPACENKMCGSPLGINGTCYQCGRIATLERAARAALDNNRKLKDLLKKAKHFVVLSLSDNILGWSQLIVDIDEVLDEESN